MLTVLEILELDEPLFHQGLKALIQRPKTNAHMLSYATLAHIWMSFQQSHGPKVQIFLGRSVAARNRFFDIYN
jgi:hypothetical protein